MLQGIYKGLPVADLEQMQVDCLSQITKVRKGEQITQVTMGGKSVTKSVASVEELKVELAEIRFALQIADPVTYGKPRRRFVMDYRARTL